LQKSTQEKPGGGVYIARMKGTRHLTIVIKIGSSSIVDETTHQPILSILALIVETAIKLRRDGHRVVIVSSGAIAVGLQRMNIPKKPKHLPQVQVRHVLDLIFIRDCWLSIIVVFRNHCLLSSSVGY
jgi:glutamate 5-kinase